MAASTRENMVSYPPVFVVDGQPAYMLPPQTSRHRGNLYQTLLTVLVTLALVSMAVEGCFIYYLYTNNSASLRDPPTPEKMHQERSVEITTKTRTDVKPFRPAAHLTVSPELPRKDGVLLWNVEGAFTHEMGCSESKLIARKEGFYFIYSSVFYSERGTLFTHEVLKSSPRFPTSDMALMRALRFLPLSLSPGTFNSYLGGMFHLFEGDAVFVRVHNYTLLRKQTPADNFLGAFMI